MNRRDLLLGLVGLAAVPALPKLPTNGVGAIARCTGTSGARAIVRLLMADGTYRTIGELTDIRYEVVRDLPENPPYVLGEWKLKEKA